MANSRKHLIYLVYGRQTYHQEALFSIASAFAHLRDGAAHGLTVRVYTDDPSPYAGLPVQVREVTAEELVAWCQPHGYHFRAKHVALRDALEDADQALLIDTDTFFHSSPLRLFDRIQPGSLLCNAIGARYGEHRNFPLYRDLSPYLFRSTASRVVFADRDFPAHDTRDLEPGDVVVVNGRGGRYKGELQIVRRPIPNDGTRNVVATVEGPEAALLDCLDSWTPFTFVEEA